MLGTSFVNTKHRETGDLTSAQFRAGEEWYQCNEREHKAREQMESVVRDHL